MEYMPYEVDSVGVAAAGVSNTLFSPLVMKEKWFYCGFYSDLIKCMKSHFQNHFARVHLF